ncbi:unnamed protein product [Rotaria sp. Silwood2]|nr:unnamed protein product [Rotaria sp. Silwood2]
MVDRKYLILILYDGDQRHQILTFWKNNERRLPVLSIIAERILVIQASSAESERHFSAGGVIVNEKRGCLSESSVGSSIVLREAYVNKMWPKCNTSAALVNRDDQEQQP